MQVEPEAQFELIGREAEQERLRRLVARLESGMGGAVVVTGSPGVGKSALLQYVAAHVRSGRPSGDIGVSHVGAVESERDWPYSGLHLLLSSWPTVASPGRDEADPVERTRALLSGVSDNDAPYDVARRFQELVNQVSTAVVVLVDDAHLLDRRSQEVLGFVARRLRSAPVGVVLTADSSQHAGAFNGLATFHLDGLTAEQATALVQRAGGPQTVAQVASKIATQVGGNPLALLDVVSHIPGPQLAGHVELERYLPLSPVLSAWPGQELDQLDEAQRHALLVASASDDGRLAPVLEAIGSDMSLVTWLLNSYVAESDGAFVLRPPSVASVIWRTASYAQRCRAHEALASVYAGKDPDRQLWHRAQAQHDEDDDLATELERTARTLMVRGELERALAYARESVRLTANTLERVDRIVAMGRLAHVTGRLHEAIQAAHERFRVEPTVEQRADLVLLEAHARNLLDADVAVGLVTRHAEEVADLDPNRAAGLHVCAALGFARRMEPSEAHRFLLLAERHVDHFDDATQESFRCVAAWLASVSGELDRAVELSERAPASGDLVADAEHRVCRAMVLMRAERFDEARDQLRTVILDERLAESPVLLADAHAASVMLEARAGRLKSVYDAASAWQRVGCDGWQAVVPAHMTRVHALLGEYEMAWECRRQAVECSQRLGGWWARALVQSETGALLLLSGRLDEAISVLEHARRYALDRADPATLMAEPDYIEACVRNGELSRAAAAVPELEQRTVQTPSAWAEHTLARCHALVSEGEESVALFRAAVDVHTESVSPVELSRTMLCFGERLRRLGRRVEAAEWLYRAIVVAEECGALALATRGEEELRASGRVAPSQAMRAAELTEAERRVATLVAAGKRNREIAAELFVSVRTVEAQLGRIFRKLGIRSRTELAGFVAADGFSG